MSEVEEGSLSYESLCLPHREYLKGVAMRLTRNPSDAEDLVQDVLLRAFRFWSTFTPIGEPTGATRGWLHCIMNNVYINTYHTSVRRTRTVTSYRHEVAESHDPRLEECGLSDEVVAAMLELDADQRRVVVLADFRGESYRQIASTLKVPIGTVMSRLYRARRRLSTLLAGYAAEQYGFDVPPSEDDEAEEAVA